MRERFRFLKPRSNDLAAVASFQLLGRSAFHSSKTLNRWPQCSSRHRTHDRALPSPWSRMDRYLRSRAPWHRGHRGLSTVTVVSRRRFIEFGTGSFVRSIMPPSVRSHRNGWGTGRIAGNSDVF